MKQSRTVFLAILLAAFLANGRKAAQAADWPMYRHDAGRGNASPEPLPANLQLGWTRQLPPARPAWPASQEQLQFDAYYQPIVAGQRLILGSTVNDSVTAYDTRTGAMAWRFFTGGPVRFAPVASKQRVYAVSDDGYLYCLDLDTGKLLWKVRGGPSDRKVIGNDRLVSAWPIRGGLVVADDTVYFAASIWPFMGIFVHAVDAQSGDSVWVNSQLGSLWLTHPHGAPSFGSVVPQGYLAVSGDNLIVPGGRSLPAVLDRATGELRHFDFGGKSDGGWQVAAHRDFYVVGQGAFHLRDGGAVARLTADILSRDWLVGDGKLLQLPGELRESIQTDRRGKQVKRVELQPQRQWPLNLDGMRPLALAGNQLYTGGNGRIARYSLEAIRQIAGDNNAPGDDKAPGDNKAPPQPDWSAEISGEAVAAVAADERLFVVTRDARIHCFALRAEQPRDWPLEKTPAPLVSAGGELVSAGGELVSAGVESEQAAALLRRAGTPEGYAVAWGVGSGRLIEQVLDQSQLHVVVIDPDQETVDQFRQSMDARGRYGTRTVALVGDAESVLLPPYFAQLQFGEREEADEPLSPRRIEAMFQSLRPYGGVTGLRLSDERHAQLERLAGNLAGAKTEREGPWSWLIRDGALPESGSWTHQYADASNSVVSSDELVKPPLGLLWFGGPPNDKILPRHGHGPSPQVAGGRLVIEGADMLRCVDVYTGRVLWEREFPGLGKYYDTTAHFAGAGEIGSNYVTLPDSIYVVYGNTILQLDAATGQTRKQFQPPEDLVGKNGSENSSENGSANGSEAARAVWGFAAVDGDLLVATLSPVTLDTSDDGNNASPSGRRPGDALAASRYAAASRHLVVLDRHTGRRLWSRTAEFNFRHNCVVVAKNRVFCIDGMSASKLQVLKRRGLEPQSKPRLLTLDARTGKEVWSTSEEVFGTFLNYSAEHDVLLQAGSAYRDRARDEAASGMVAYRGADGQVLWRDPERKHGGPCLLWGDKIITNGGGGYQLELLTGKETGWKYTRMYGCNTAVGSRHMLTFRSGAAGFCDLTGDSGTGNIGGFRSSCTANLVIADGVLNAPDYTRTCTCAYQNQCSLALVHMPEAESWTFSSRATLPVRYGVNLGAPGDRRAESGVIWYEYPSTGGNSPELPLKLTGSPTGPRTVRHHVSRLEKPAGDTDSSHSPWIAASCVTNLLRLEYTLPPEANGPQRYTVRLHFAELEDREPGQRQFQVAIQGKTVLPKMDIAEQAGGAFIPLTREIRGVEAGVQLVIEFKPLRGEPCLSGVELVREDS